MAMQGYDYYELKWFYDFDYRGIEKNCSARMPVLKNVTKLETPKEIYRADVGHLNQGTVKKD